MPANLPAPFSRRARPRHRHRRLVLEPLENRALLAAVITVNSTDDADNRDAALTLREAILISNRTLDVASLTAAEQAQVIGTPTGNDTNTIAFGIAGNGVKTIRPAIALPSITDPVVIDGYTQPGASPNPNAIDNPDPEQRGLNGTLLIQLSQDTSSPASISGLTVTGNNSTIRGLIINGFQANGIAITGGSGNVVEGSYIGTNSAGSAAIGNKNRGILLAGGAASNRIGGTAPAARNLISGNETSGVGILNPGSNDNVIVGNLMGTNRAGTARVGNLQRGVNIFDGAQRNRVGTNSDGVNDSAERNVLSGNGWDGVGISTVGTSNNLVAGNYIGTDITGKLSVGNALHGVWIFDGSTLNTIGGSVASARNVISGNVQDGVLLSVQGTSNNVVAANYIGIDESGVAPLPNSTNGVRVETGATQNLIGTDGDGVGDAAERNVISGNLAHGIVITGAGTDGNVIAGNLIGTNASGLAAVGNGDRGVNVGAKANRIGTNADGLNDASERNVISGNGGEGVVFTGAGSSQNVLTGNFIGTDVTGSAALGNTRDGVALFAGASQNTIGGTSLAARNLISGNLLSGVLMSGSATTDNVIAGNFIGSDVTGLLKLANKFRGVAFSNGASNTTIGGLASGAGNLIAFNELAGVFIFPPATKGIAVLGNSIHSNGSLGIALDQDGVTPNDPGDADTGPNNFQNFPELNKVELGNGVLRVTYRVDSNPANSTYPLRIEFFRSDGAGQGQDYLGFDTYTTADFAAGLKSVVFNVGTTLGVSDEIVATATDSVPGGGPANTSEFTLDHSLAALAAWHNPVRPLDVNNSGQVSVIDALLVINYLNGDAPFGPGPVPEGALIGRPFGFIDTNGERNISPIDALLVINEINAGAGEGEQNSASPESDLASFDALIAVLAADSHTSPKRKRG